MLWDIDCRGLSPVEIISHSTTASLIHILKMGTKWQQQCPPKLSSTLPETNIAPENAWLEYSFPFGMAYFQGYVSFRECTCDTKPI